jgi:hypothetical protein
MANLWLLPPRLIHHSAGEQHDDGIAKQQPLEWNPLERRLRLHQAAAVTLLLLLMMIFVVGGGVVPPLLVRQQHWKLLEAAAAVVVVVVVVAECRFRRPHHTGCHLIEGVVLLALFLL